MKYNRVIFIALKEEYPFSWKPPGYNIVYTGIGKTNAAMCAAKFLTANPHVDRVYNYGTAGAADDSVAGELLEVGAVLERDMDLTPLGLDRYITEQNQVPHIYTSNRDTEIICGTGDSFARPKPPDYHIVDMEAYAIARVCLSFDIPFYCYKYISDTDSDEDPGKAWRENVAKGAKKFKNIIF